MFTLQDSGFFCSLRMILKGSGLNYSCLIKSGIQSKDKDKREVEGTTFDLSSR